MIRRILRVSGVIFGFILLLEGVLQLLALVVNPWKSFDDFLTREVSKAIVEVNQSPGKKHLFFVGDSHVYGLGATRAELGLIPQFKALASNEIQDLICHNLGYPGSSSLDHLMVLKQLPEDSVVVLRTGANNLLDTRFEKALTVFWPDQEIKIIKLLHFLLEHEKSKSAQEKIFALIWQVAREKGFKLILMGYSYKKSLSEDYFTERGMVLSPSDFLTTHNQDPRKFLSYNGRHPNDMGYSFEATLLLHFFQRKGILSKAKNLVNFKPGMETFQLWRPWLESEIQSLKISLMNMANSTCLDLRHLLSLTYELSMVDRGLVDTDYEDLVKLLVLGCNDQLIARETLNAIQNQSPLPLPQPKAMESMLKVHIETISEGLLIRPQRLDQCLPKHLQFEITLALERSWRHLLGKISAGGDDTCGQISLRTNLKKK